MIAAAVRMGAPDMVRDWASQANNVDGSDISNLERVGAGHSLVTFKASFKTAIVNRKSAMLLLSQAKVNKLQTLCSFLPTIVLRKLSRLTREEASTMRPAREDFHECAVAMLDMCGFTRLAEGLRQGKLLNNDGAAQTKQVGAAQEQPKKIILEDRDLANTCSRAMMSAKLLRLQTTDEAQAGFGAEQLKVVLNTFFKLLMSTITDHGGDVLRLAGDALIVAFPDGNGQRGMTDPVLLRRAALVCALCLKRLDGMKIQGHVMNLHVALGVGTLQLYTVGNAEGGWQYVAAGEPFSDLATAMDDGTAGEMVVSCNYWKAMSTTINTTARRRRASSEGWKNSLSCSEPEIDGHLTGGPDGTADENGSSGGGGGGGGGCSSGEGCSSTSSTLGGVKWNSGRLESGNVKLKASAEAAEIEAALSREDMDFALQDRQGQDRTDGGHGARHDHSTTASVAEELMRKQEFLERVIRRFIPPPILYVCEAEESGWFAEIGRVAVIFVNIAIKGLPGMDVMQSVYLVLQRAMKSSQGVIKEFSVDDKGTVMVGALGLPPITGSNPSARACMTATKIMKGIEALGIVCYIGISFGPVFTASIGGTRREFMLVGDVVNTAARLMSAGKTLRQESLEAAAAAAAAAESSTATEPEEAIDVAGPTPARFSSGVVAVDSVTAGLARGLVEFELLGTISLKGKLVPVEIHTPLGPAAASRSDGRSFDMIGRADLRAMLLERASSLMQGFEGGLLVLQGEPGVGKTLLVEECGRDWRREGVQTLGLNQPSSRFSNGAPFSAWKGVMHSVLLLHRSLVLPAMAHAASEHDDRGGSGSNSGAGGGGDGLDQDGGAGVEERLREAEGDARAPKRARNRRSNDTDAGGQRGKKATGTKSSTSGDAQWAAAQASADAAVVAAAAKERAAAGGVGVNEIGQGSLIKSDSSSSQSLKALTPEQLQSARDIAGQLDTETRVLRSMHSADDGSGEEETQSGGTAEKFLGREMPSSLPPPSPSETVDRLGAQNPAEPAEEARNERYDELAEEDRSSSDSLLHSRDEDEAPPPGSAPPQEEQQHQQNTAPGTGNQPETAEKISSPSTYPTPAFNNGARRDMAASNMPWWAGAFGAVPDMRDSPEARGFYARRFCEIFFPDNVAGATEVLCNLLEGQSPVEQRAPREMKNERHATSPPMTTEAERSSSGGLHTACDSVGIGGKGFQGDSAGDCGTGKDGNEGGCSSGPRGSSGGGGHADEDGEKPEKSCFNVLLGMLTIATMVDAGGEAGLGSLVLEECEGHDQGLPGNRETMILEDFELEAGGSTCSSTTTVGGLRGVVAVLDDGQEMDRCSCDLVKASTKYLHQRLLVVLVSPPLPGIVTQRRRSNDSGGGGRQDGDDDDEGNASTSGSSGSGGGSADDGCWSEDNDDLAAVSHILPMFHVNEELESGGAGETDDSRSPVDAGAGSNSAAAKAAAEFAAPPPTAPARSRDDGKNDAPTGRLPESQTEAATEAPDLETPAEVESLSRSKGGERPGVTPDIAGGSANNVAGGKAKGHRAELAATRAGSRTMGKTGRRSMTSMGRRSGGKGGRASGDACDEAPANTPHLQIGAAAFMEAGNAATSSGAGGTKRGVVSIVDHGRRDSGFIRYWNPGTIKLLDILVSLQHKTTVETVRVRSLRYEETVQLGCRHLSCDELDPLVGVALYLRTNGNPLFVIGYCNLMVERNLGEVVLATPAGPTPKPNPSHQATVAGAPAKVENNQSLAIETNVATDVTGRSVVEAAAAATVKAVLEDVVVGMARRLEKSGEREQDAGEDVHGDDHARHSTPKEKPPTTVFRFQQIMNVFKVLDSTVPSSVESRIIAFLGCLSAQQSFILRVMSVIGTQGVEAELLEAVYPIPIKGSTLREDLHALEACRLIKIERVANEAALAPGTRSSPAASAATAATSTRDSSAGRGPAAARAQNASRDRHRLLLSFRDLVIHQVLYKRLSHNHRNQLHGNIADWLSERQQQGSGTDQEDLVAGNAGGGARRRRSSFESGKAVLMGKTVAPTQRTPMIVHHLTLAHQEQKAMIRAHLFGVRELEAWAMGAFAVILEKHTVGVPEDLLRLTKECKEFMWLCPSLIGILKTLLAIRSGAGVSNATTKFRHTMRSTRGDRQTSESALPGTDVLLEAEEEKHPSDAEPTTSVAEPTASHEEEERPECGDEIDAKSLTPSCDPQHRREPCGDNGENARFLVVEGGPDEQGCTNRGRRSSSLASQGQLTRLSASESCPGLARERNMSVGSREKLGTRTGRTDSRRGAGRRRNKRGGADGRREKFPSFSTTPPLLHSQPSCSPLPSPILSQSLTGARSIYSSLGDGSGGGASRPNSFGVITGPFTNRQGSFRNRHLRPRAADGSTSPTRSAVWIFVTTRSNFDSSPRRRRAAGSAAGRRLENRRKRNCVSARLDRRGVANALPANGRDRPGTAGTGTGTTGSHAASSGDQSPAPHRNERPKTVPLETAQASPFVEGSGSWFCSTADGTSASGTREDRSRASETAARGSRRVERDGSDSPTRRSHRDACRGRAGTGGTATAARTGFVASVRGGVGRPDDGALTPEGAAARLASIRKVYRPGGVGPLLCGFPHATSSLQTSLSPSIGARSKGRRW